MENLHSDLISDLDVCSAQPTTFATASKDGKVALWDLRQPDKASGVHNLTCSGFAPPSSVHWVPKDEHRLLVGDFGGNLHVVDSRKTDIALCTQRVGGQRINKIRFCQERADLLATAGDARTLRIFSFDGDATISLRYLRCCLLITPCFTNNLHTYFK